MRVMLTMKMFQVAINSAKLRTRAIGDSAVAITIDWWSQSYDGMTALLE